MSIKNALIGKSVNGVIKKDAAAAIGAQADNLLERSTELLEKLEKQVGMFLGGEIKTLVAEIKGTSFNEVMYHHDREPEGQ